MGENCGKQAKTQGSHKRPLKRSMVCHVCGGRGCWKHLCYCSECFDRAAHWYCLILEPGSIDEKGTVNVHWVCECCCSSMETELTASQLCGEALTKSAENNCTRDGEALRIERDYEKVFVEDQPEPRQVLLLPSYSDSVSVEGRKSSQRQCAEEATNAALTSMAHCDEAPVSCLLTEIPEAIMSGLVLVVSSSGGTIVHDSRSFSEGLHSCETSPLRLKDVDKGAHEDKESRQDYNLEDTLVLDFGAEEDIDSFSLGQTVELDLGTDEEHDVCFTSVPAASINTEKHQDSSYNSAVGENDEVQQAVSALDKPQPLSGGACNRRKSNSNSQDSVSISYDCKDLFTKAIEASKSSRTTCLSEMSFSSSFLGMTKQLCESNLEKINTPTQVDHYTIRSDLAPILRKILDHYGDIFCDCSVELNTQVVIVCRTVQHLQGILLKHLRQQHVDFVRDSLKIPEALEVDVKWLIRHCDYLETVIHQIAQYFALKREWENSIRRVRDKKQLLSVKKETSCEVKEELKILEDDLKLDRDHTKKLQSEWQRITSLLSEIYDKSSAEGLF